MSIQLGQLTNKDCWISTTVLSFYLIIEDIPGVYISDRNIILPTGETVILKDIPRNNLEAVLRATRVYFSKANNLLQQYMDIDNLDIYGCPDLVSELYFKKKFNVYSTSILSFYSFLHIESCKQRLLNRKEREIFLLTFNFNRSHLYIFINFQDDNNINVIDVSFGVINKVILNYKFISILMSLEI